MLLQFKGGHFVQKYPKVSGRSLLPFDGVLYVPVVMVTYVRYLQGYTWAGVMACSRVRFLGARVHKSSPDSHQLSKLCHKLWG